MNLSKVKKFYMYKESLDHALDSCDLGDSYHALVCQYPHKDYLSKYYEVQIVLPGQSREEILREAVDFLRLELSQGLGEKHETLVNSIAHDIEIHFQLVGKKENGT